MPQTRKNFSPHPMYDPKTGKAHKASTYDQHLELKEKGFTHSPPSKAGTRAKKLLKKKSGY
jgi:hypothetical protein